MVEWTIGRKTMRTLKQPARVPLGLALLGLVLASLGAATATRPPGTAAAEVRHSG